MMQLIRLIRRDVRRAYGQGGALLPVAFVLLVAVLFPFAVGPDAALLRKTGAGVIWVAALLAALLPIERLIAPDLEHGVFDQLALRGISEEMVSVARIIAHWISFAPPVLIAALPTATLFGIEGDALTQLMLGLLLATPALAALAVMTAALTAGLRGASAISGLILLPLAIPVLIFGAGGNLKLLAASTLFLLAIAPFATAAAIRASRN